MTLTIEGLKEQARRHEQDEQWRPALDLYLRAIGRLEAEDRPDTALHNRVGDLCTRVGDTDRAAEHYEIAVDLYEEAGLPNNAIAVCKKIIRNVPERERVYLRMGLIRARQGFLVDARQCFLTYAERMKERGDVDEALRSLVEFADLVPDDVEIRLSIATAYEQHERKDEAVAQLIAAHGALVRAGDDAGAHTVAMRIRSLDPEIDLSAPVDAPMEASLDVVGFEPTALGGAAEPGESLDALAEIPEAPPEAPASEGQLPDSPQPPYTPPSDFEIALDHATPSEGPTTRTGEPSGEEMASAGADVAGSGEPAESEVAPLPLLDGTEAFAAPLDLGAGPQAAAPAAGDVEAHQRLVEQAFQGSNDDLVGAYLGLAAALEGSGSGERARSVYQQVLALDPDNAAALAGVGRAQAAEGPPPEVASSEDYVDLGALILGDDEEEKTTRFVVEYEEPTGDEDADFQKMLSQFKAKVAENVDPSDLKAHHDLGTAYKEMGLLDEAIEEFQKALRASGDHLPTYETLGQTFLEKGAAAAAARVLTRALESPWEVEDELLGIYYYLGRAHEELGNTPQAVEFYDRVFSLDINFADVTERLRALR